MSIARSGTNEMKLLLLINDNYFSFLLAKPVIERYHESTSLAVFSVRASGSLPRIIRIYKSSSKSYFFYRTIVQAISYINGMLRRNTIGSMVQSYKINSVITSDINRDVDMIAKFAPFDVGVAINFDQIVGEELIKFCDFGIINVHGSKLPDGKGISPVLWDFARGDKEVWVTIYKMDSGIDTGPILRQFKILVRPEDTFFSLYERVCVESSAELLSYLEKVENYQHIPVFQQIGSGGIHRSWPDDDHRNLMRSNKRSYINIPDIIRAIFRSDNLT